MVTGPNPGNESVWSPAGDKNLHLEANPCRLPAPAIGKNHHVPNSQSLATLFGCRIWGSPSPLRANTWGSGRDSVLVACCSLSPPGLRATQSLANAAGGRPPGLPRAGQSRASMQMRLLSGPGLRLPRPGVVVTIHGARALQQPGSAALSATASSPLRVFPFLLQLILLGIFFFFYIGTVGRSREGGTRRKGRDQAAIYLLLFFPEQVMLPNCGHFLENVLQLEGCGRPRVEASRRQI